MIKRIDIKLYWNNTYWLKSRMAPHSKQGSDGQVKIGSKISVWMKEDKQSWKYWGKFKKIDTNNALKIDPFK